MGSFIHSRLFPKEKLEAFLDAFSKIPQRVIWKWEGDPDSINSDKILVGPWMPQKDILGKKQISQLRYWLLHILKTPLNHFHLFSPHHSITLRNEIWWKKIMKNSLANASIIYCISKESLYQTYSLLKSIFHFSASKG